MMAERLVVETENLKKSFRCNIDNKEKERRSIRRKYQIGIRGRVLFEPARSIDQFKEVCR